MLNNSTTKQDVASKADDDAHAAHADGLVVVEKPDGSILRIPTHRAQQAPELVRAFLSDLVLKDSKVAPKSKKSGKKQPQVEHEDDSVNTIRNFVKVVSQTRKKMDAKFLKKSNKESKNAVENVEKGKVVSARREKRIKRREARRKVMLGNRRAKLAEETAEQANTAGNGAKTEPIKKLSAKKEPIKKNPAKGELKVKEEMLKIKQEMLE